MGGRERNALLLAMFLAGGCARGKTETWGQYYDGRGNAVGARVEVVGVNGFNYVVETDKGRIEVPMERLLIVEGYPWPTVVTDPKLGYRLDGPDYMDRLPLGGASHVRISGPYEEIGNKNSKLERAIAAAEKAGLVPFVIFAPIKPLPDGVIRDKLATLIKEHPMVTVELLNEPDNPKVGFWQGRDLNTAAHFLAVAVSCIRQINPQTRIVIGALVDVNKEAALIVAMKREQLDLSGLIWGVHAYQTRESVRQRIATVKNALTQNRVRGEIWVTELGVKYDWRSKDVLREMAEEAFDQGVVGVSIHELLDWEGFGLVSPDWSRVYPIFFEMSALARERR